MKKKEKKKGRKYIAHSIYHTFGYIFVAFMRKMYTFEKEIEKKKIAKNERKVTTTNRNGVDELGGGGKSLSLNKIK